MQWLPLFVVTTAQVLRHLPGLLPAQPDLLQAFVGLALAALQLREVCIVLRLPSAAGFQSCQGPSVATCADALALFVSMVSPQTVAIAKLLYFG